MLARESWSLKESTEEALKQIRYARKVVVIPLGLPDGNWVVRAGFTDEIREPVKTNITVHDTDGKRRNLEIQGDKTAVDVEEISRKKWHLKHWIKVTVARRDSEPFSMEKGGDYTITTQYSPDADPRPSH